MEKHDGTESSEESKFRDRQLLAALGPLLSMLTVGLTLGFNTVQLIQLTSDVTTNESRGAEVRITSEGEAHLLFSASSFPMLLGCLLSAILAETVGRRRSLMIIYPVSLIGWASIGLASDVSSIAIGRAIHGLGAGLFTPLAPVYIGEISDPRSRSVFLALIDAAIVFGLLIVNHLHAYLHWRIIVGVCSAVTCLVSLATLASRESPVWLMNRNRAGDALSQWIHLRGWESGMDEYRDASKRVSNARSGNRSGYRALSSKRFLYPLLVSNASFFVYRFSGLNLVAGHAVPPLVETFEMDDSHSATLIILGLRSITSLVACHLITKYEWKTLIFNSGSGTVFSLFALWLTAHFDLRSLWLKDISLLVYFVSLGIGLSPIPWILSGELFSGKLRSFGIGLVLALSYLCYIVDTIVTPELVARIKVQGVYVIYSLLVIVGVALLDRVLPEPGGTTRLCRG